LTHHTNYADAADRLESPRIDVGWVKPKADPPPSPTMAVMNRTRPRAPGGSAALDPPYELHSICHRFRFTKTAHKGAGK